MAKRKNRSKSGKADSVRNRAVAESDSAPRESWKHPFASFEIGPGNPKATMLLAALLAALTVVALAPFLGKAFHIDDPLYLWTAKHILHAPLDFYGFNLNWYGTEEPMSRVMKNPPLLSYYLALVGLLFGWGEVAIHTAMLLPALAAMLGIFFLARQLCPRPFEASLICLFTPVFLVSATTVMCDVLMLSCWVWAVFFWIRGIASARPGYLALGALLMAMAALSKYYGMAVVPLLFVFSLIKKRELGWWALFFLVPLLTLAGYQWSTQSLYGKGLLLDAASFPIVRRPYEYTGIARGFIGLDFLGGCLLGSLFYLPFLWRRSRIVSWGVVFLMVSAFVAGSTTIGGYPIHDAHGPRWGIILQFSLFVVAGLNILALAAADLWVRLDAASALLAMWVAGTLIFASHINWTINARSVLPLLPAAGILIARRLESQCGSRRARLNHAWALIPAALLAIMVAWSDYALAGRARAAAVAMNQRSLGAAGALYYQGTWGFHYYMDALGAKRFQPGAAYAAGDIVVAPANSPRIIPPDPGLFKRLEDIEMPSFPGLATMRRPSGAGFYADVLGPLPFAFGLIPPERYLVWRFSD